jgi:hypothetical protein
MDQPKYLRRAPSTEYLRRVWGIEIAPATLQKKCVRGCGPATTRCGRVALHSIEALDAFAKTHLKSFVGKAAYAGLAATAPSTPALPPIAPTGGEWRPTA